MPRGLTALQESSPEGGGSDYVRNIKLLDDREFTTLRFLTDAEGLYYESFHRNMVDGQFKGFKVCLKSKGQPCSMCALKDNRPSTQFLAWVYEYDHFFTSPTENAEEVTLGRSKSRKAYKREVNEVRLMRYSNAHRGGLVGAVEEYDTLMDRTFKWVRDGKRGSTRPTYDLRSLKEEPLSDELKVLAETLPDLEEVAFGRTERLDGAPVEEQKDKAEKYATRDVSTENVIDDDEDEAEPYSDDDDDGPF